MSSAQKRHTYRFVFNIKQRFRETYKSEPRLSIQTPDGLEEPPAEIQAITPKLYEENRQGDIVTWMAAAGEHTDLNWYKEQLMSRGFKIEFFNEEQDRLTISLPAQQ